MRISSFSTWKVKGQRASFDATPKVFDLGAQVRTMSCFHRAPGAAVIQHQPSTSIHPPPAKRGPLAGGVFHSLPRLPLTLLTQGLPQILREKMPWLKLVVSYREPISRSISKHVMLWDKNQVRSLVWRRWWVKGISRCWDGRRSPSRTPTSPPTHPLTHSPTHPLTHSPTHPLTHSPTHPPPTRRRSRRATRCA